MVKYYKFYREGVFMNKSQFIFKAIDVVFDKPQNPYNIENIYSVKDITYSDIDPKMTVGDLYFNPEILKDGKKHPIILNIHGGGFVMGDKEYRKTLSELYASRGYYVYNVNYRMPPAVNIFGCIEDSVNAANHINSLAEEYSIDTDKIFISGDSAGAFLAAYLGALRFNEGLNEELHVPEIKIDIAGLVLNSGPYDLKAMLSAKLPLGIIPELASMLVGFQLKEDLSDIYDYEYFKYMSVNDFVNEKWCPAFISWSDSDFICPNQGRPMAEKLMKNCPYVATSYADGLLYGHDFHLTLKNEKSMQCVESGIKFMDKVCEDIDKKKVTI